MSVDDAGDVVAVMEREVGIAPTATPLPHEDRGPIFTAGNVLRVVVLGALSAFLLYYVGPRDIAETAIKVLLVVALTAAFRHADGAFAWRQPPYEYEHEKMPFDILAGSSALREQIDAGESLEAIARSWEPAVAEFGRLRAKFLMY